MIQFKDWRLEWDGSPVAMQFDNGSVRLEIVGEMPTGYDWELLVREPEGGMDILALEKQPDGVGVLLKRENLPKWGTYALQLRGTLQADGTTQRHSTVAEVLVPESLSGGYGVAGDPGGVPPVGGAPQGAGGASAEAGKRGVLAAVGRRGGRVSRQQPAGGSRRTEGR